MEANKDRAERHDLWSRFLPCWFILLFFFPLFLGGKRKRKRITKVVVKSHAFLLDRKQINLNWRRLVLNENIIVFVYQKALIRTYHTNFLTTQFLCEFTALEHKLRRWFCTLKPILNVRFKEFWYTKINPTQIWYDKLKVKTHYTHNTNF